MSGVYIYEISPRQEGEKNIIKIGRTDYCVEKRIEDSFNENFDRNNFSYYPIELIPCNKSVAVALENYMINVFMDYFSPDRFKGREFFYCTKGEVSKLVEDIPNIVLDFYEFFRSYSKFDLSISSIIKFKRKKLGMSQQELSKLTGLRQPTISEYENGKIGNFSTLKTLMSHLDVSIVFLNNENQNSLLMLNS